MPRHPKATACVLGRESPFETPQNQKTAFARLPLGVSIKVPSLLGSLIQTFEDAPRLTLSSTLATP